MTKPTEEKTSVFIEAGTANLKLPSVTVWVAVLVPLAVTVTPAMPLPVESLTRPVTIRSCAKLSCEHSSSPGSTIDWSSFLHIISNH